MEFKNPKFHDGQRGAALAVRVIPRSRRDEISEIMDDGTVKIRLTAPPVDGKANRALISFLAELLEVPNGSIEIVAGETSRKKLITILDVDREWIQRKIQANI